MHLAFPLPVSQLLPVGTHYHMKYLDNGGLLCLDSLKIISDIYSEKPKLQDFIIHPP